jgi:hypothetical protein
VIYGGTTRVKSQTEYRKKRLKHSDSTKTARKDQKCGFAKIWEQDSNLDKTRYIAQQTLWLAEGQPKRGCCTAGLALSQKTGAERLHIGRTGQPRGSEEWGAPNDRPENIE